MGVVFQYKDESFVNVVGRDRDYDGGLIKSKATEETFQKIESRYVNSIAAQIQIQNKNKKNVNDLLALMNGDEDKLNELVAGVENLLANQFNEAAEKFDATLGQDVISAKATLRNAINNLAEGKGTKESAINALDKMFDIAFKQQRIMTFYNNLRGMAPGGQLTKKQAFKAGLQEVMGYNQIRQKIEEISQGNGIQGLASGVQGLLTAPTELVPSLIDSFGQNKVNRTLIQTLQESKKGTKGKLIFDTDLAIDRKVYTKAADSQFIKRRVTVQDDPDNPKITYNFDIQPYVSTKFYEKSENIRLISHAMKQESQSMLLDLLHQIYGRSEETDYQLYNSLAFKDYQNRGDLNTNFRIIRSDLTAYYAEKFIVGFTSSDMNEAQMLLIYNGKAYPILSIISKIVEQGIQATRDGRYYGNFEENDLFRINIVSVGNKWIGKEASTALKAERVKKVTNAIMRLGMQGTINIKAFQQMFENTFRFEEIQGINLT